MNETTTPQLLRLPMGNDQLFRLTVLRHAMSLDLATGAPDPSSLDAGTPLALDAPDIMNLRIRIYAVECGHRFEPKWRIESQQLIIELEADKTLEHQKGIYRLELSLEEVDPNYIDGKRSLTLTRDLCLVTDESASTDGTPQDYTLTAPALLSASPELQKLIQSAQSGAIDENRIVDLIDSHLDIRGGSIIDDETMNNKVESTAFAERITKQLEALQSRGAAPAPSAASGQDKALRTYLKEALEWFSDPSKWEEGVDEILSPEQRLGKFNTHIGDLSGLEYNKGLDSAELARIGEALSALTSKTQSSPTQKAVKALYYFGLDLLFSENQRPDVSQNNQQNIEGAIQGYIQQKSIDRLIEESPEWQDATSLLTKIGEWMDLYAGAVASRASNEVSGRIKLLEDRVKALEQK